MNLRGLPQTPLEDALAIPQLGTGSRNQLLPGGNAALNGHLLAQGFSGLDDTFFETSVGFHERDELPIALEERTAGDDRGVLGSRSQLYRRKHAWPQSDLRGVYRCFGDDVSRRGSHLRTDVLERAFELAIGITGDAEPNLGAGLRRGNVDLGNRELEP